MKTLTLLKTGVAPLALGLTLLASPALAQADTAAQPQVADEPAAPTGEIIVTGSRFQNPNITSISPVTVVNALEVKNQRRSHPEPRQIERAHV